jgi:dipeptidyl aminopeptidase/acylaminoacyl peptidase
LNHHLRGAAAALLLACASTAYAVPDSQKRALLAPFLAPAGYFTASLSPDGTRVAMVSLNPHPEVVIVDLDKLTSWGLAPRTVDRVDPDRPGRTRTWIQNPIGVHWIDDERLAVDFVKQPSWHVHLDGMKATYDWSYEGRYVGTIRVAGQSARAALVADIDSGVIRRKVSGDAAPQSIEPGMPGGETWSWRQDKTGLVRIARTRPDRQGLQGTRVETWYRRGDADRWTLVDSRDVSEEDFDAVGVIDDPNQILVLARNGGDRTGVWRYDVTRHAFLELVAARPDADVTLVERNTAADGVAAVQTEGLSRETIWFDDRMKQLQAAVDAALPDSVNALEPGAAGRMLVESASDVDPGRLYVLDTRTLKMQFVADRRPAIDPKRMQPMQMLRYAAADGLQVPAYFTLPGRPSKPVPMVVLVHGGPQVRDHWAWNEEVQVLAAHGYAVFQPQFRGSTGFGRHHEEAGYGQWGLAMQDDITAGVEWLITHHVADPERICIVGASYGGYAALWGLEKTPDLYKCGVSMAGVSDLERELTVESDVSKSSLALDLLKHRVGDPSLMKVAFDQVSPVKHADRIKASVLLVHGALDKRVPITQGELMYDALYTQHVNFDWMRFEDEEHGIAKPENRTRYYMKMLMLLEHTIGDGLPPVAP